MKRPAPDALRFAAEWLDEYEDPEGAPPALVAVSAWLREQADDAERVALERKVRSALRQAGIEPTATRVRNLAGVLSA